MKIQILALALTTLLFSCEEDRVFAEDINQIKNIIADFSFVERVNAFAASKGCYLNKGWESFEV